MVISMELKTTVPERRLRNSGLKVFFTVASMASPCVCPPAKPMAACEAYCAPALEVMMRITLRKSALLPLLSVRLA